MNAGIYPLTTDIHVSDPKVGWRKHEMIGVTLASITAIATCCRDWLALTPQRLNSAYIIVYNSNNHTPFNYLINVWLPKIGGVLLFYLAYLAINRLIIPSVKRESSKDVREQIVKKIIWLVVQFVLLSFLVGLGTNLITYFAHPYFFNYGGFQFLALFGYNDHPLTYMFTGFGSSMGLIILFILLALVRELIIQYIQRPSYRRAYRIFIVNQLTTFGVIYFSLLAIALALDFEKVYTLFVAYIAVIPSAFLVFMTNTYWLFPWKGKRPFLYYRVLLRLLLSTLICTFPFFAYNWNDFPYDRFILFLFCWAGQLVVTTPLSWLAYRYQKDRILYLRGIEKELVRSKADLQFLRSQINPHFLFNALNTLYGIALREKSADTAKGIQMLGDMMRFMLHENALDLIPMRKEIEYLKNYISLQKLRIETSPEISIKDNIEGQDCDHLIAPMLLIPFIENAFKHGISLEEPSWIKISLTCDKKNICFEVRNSMHPKTNSDPEKDGTGIGLRNVLERLKLVYPDRHQVNIDGDGQEFLVHLVIQT